jgi:hypothetical protein
MNELESQTKKYYATQEQKLKCFNCKSRIAETVLKDFQELKNISQSLCPFCLSSNVRGKWIKTMREGKIELENNIRRVPSRKTPQKPHISFSSSTGVEG